MRLKKYISNLKIITVISASSMLFTNYAFAADLNIPATVTEVPITNEVPAGYVKANYKTKAVPVEGSKKIISPLANEISLQDAAEIAAQTLFKYYDIKLTNQTFKMCYTPSSKKTTSTWLIKINITTDYKFDLTLNASTGELIYLHSQGSAGVTKLSLSKDDKKAPATTEIASKGLPNPDKNIEQLKTLLTKRDFITEPIESVKYNSSVCIGYPSAAHPYAEVMHIFDVTTTSKKVYRIGTTYTVSEITYFNLLKK